MKILNKLIVIMIIVMIVSTNGIYAINKDYVDTKNVRSSIVIDHESKRVLFEDNAHERVAIASLTKVMTSIILAETCGFNEIVVADKGVDWIGGSLLGISSGDKITVKNLLLGMLLPSGNDAAYVSAIHVGGSMENFALMMNKKAKEIGCKDTNFVNSYGLDADGHLSTAYDTALIMSYAYNNPIIRNIIALPTSEVHYGKNSKIIKNTNRLLKMNNYCTRR